MNAKLRHTFGIALASNVALFAFAGCNSDPNRKVESAESSHAEEHAAYTQKSGEMNEKHSEQQAELEKKQAQERADLRGEYGDKLADSHKDVVTADANMTAERQSFYAKEKERLDKMDARAQLAETKLQGTVNAKSRSEATTEMQSYRTQRDTAGRKLRSVPTIPNDTWARAKTDIDSSIDEAEKSLSRVESKL